jgi:hypothetical protein
MRRLFSSLFLWLMMLALPLQGFAAASMLYCGVNTDHHAAQTQALQTHGSADSSATDHAAHEHLAAQTEVKHDAPTKLPDTGHKCGICSACYNTLGTTSPPLAVTAYATPDTRHVEPLVLAYAAPLRLLEKPPRA